MKTEPLIHNFEVGKSYWMAAYGEEFTDEELVPQLVTILAFYEHHGSHGAVVSFNEETEWHASAKELHVKLSDAWKQFAFYHDHEMSVLDEKISILRREERIAREENPSIREHEDRAAYHDRKHTHALVQYKNALLQETMV